MQNFKIVKHAQKHKSHFSKHKKKFPELFARVVTTKGYVTISEYSGPPGVRSASFLEAQLSLSL